MTYKKHGSIRYLRIGRLALQLTICKPTRRAPILTPLMADTAERLRHIGELCADDIRNDAAWLLACAASCFCACGVIGAAMVLASHV